VGAGPHGEDTEGRLADLAAWLRVTWGGVRWRRAASVMLAVVAVVAVAGAAAGPIFARSADDSALVGAVAGSPAAAEVTVSGQGGVPLRHDLERLAASPPGGRRGWYAEPTFEALDGVHLPSASGLYGSNLVAKSGLCAHLALVAGRCPVAPGAVAVSARTASALGARLGGHLEALSPARASAGVRLTVTGIYRIPATSPAGYWQDPALFDFGVSVKPQPPQVDALFVTLPTALALEHAGDPPSLSLRLLCEPDALRSGPLGGLTAALARFSARAAHDGLSVATGMPGLLAGVRSGESTAVSVVDLASVELVGVGLLVLYLVVATAAADRRDDVELALRRGFTRRQVLTVAVGEPALLLVAALPVGLAGAWATVVIVGGRIFVPGTPVGVPPVALAAGVAAVAAGVVAVVIATAELRRGAGRTGRRPERSRAVRAAVDGGAVAAAAAGLFVLSASGSLDPGHFDPVAVVSPALLALGVGVVGLRLAEGASALAVRATAARGRVAVFLASRSLARSRPSPLRRALPLTVAVVLATFGVVTWAVGATNRARVAAAETGAAEVATVTPPSGADLSNLVDRADPGGRTAMAAEEITSGSGDTLAVQAGRLAAVAAWPAGLASRPVSELAGYLAPRVEAPISFAGSALAATVTVPAGTPALALTATVFNAASQDAQVVAFPTLHPGTDHVRAPVAGFCASTCRLVSLDPTLAGARVPAEVTFVLDSLGVASADGSVRRLALDARPGGWRATPPGVGVQASSGTVRFVVPGADATSQGTLLTPADVPDPLPAVATSQALTAGAVDPGSDAFTAEGLDGGQLEVNGAVVASRLPEIGNDAVLVDLRDAELYQDAASQARFQVWLRGPRAGAVLRRLVRLGVGVDAVASAGRADRLLGHGSVAIADDLLLGSGLTAATLALAATAFGALAGARRRRADLHALSLAGLPLPSLRRALLGESLATLGVTLALGGAVGYVSAALVLHSLPQLATPPAGLPLVRSVAGGPFVVVLGATGAAFALVAVLTTRVILGRAGRHVRSPER